MSVEKLNSRIIKYRLVDEKSHGVLYYTLDLDKYSLSIGGETSADYKWVETPKTESFLELMVRCDSGYLLNKLFNRVFDLEKSINSVIEYFEEYGLFDCDYENDEKEDFLEEIKGIDCDCENCFIERVNEILDDYDKNYIDADYDLWNRIEKSYKYWDKKAVDLFCEFIKPELEKELQNG